MDVGTECESKTIAPYRYKRNDVHALPTSRSLRHSLPSVLAISPMSVIRQAKSIPQQSHDITAEDARTSSDQSISKETYQVDPVCEVVGTTGTSEDDYPDGGLRAWLIVAGVSAVVIKLSHLYQSDPNLSGNMQRFCDVSMFEPHVIPLVHSPFYIFPIHVHNLIAFASLPMLTLKRPPDAFLYLFLLVSAT